MRLVHETLEERWRSVLMFHVYASFVKCERGVSSSAYIRISVHRIRPVRGTVLRCCRPQHFSFLSGAAVLICPFTSSTYLSISVHRIAVFCGHAVCAPCSGFVSNEAAASVSPASAAFRSPDSGCAACLVFWIRRNPFSFRQPAAHVCMQHLSFCAPHLLQLALR